MATRTKTTDRERGCEELYRSRELRFRDDNHKQWLHLIGVKNGQRLAELCSVEKARHMAPDALSDEEYRDLVQKIHRRYDRRLEDYRLGVRHWGCEICTVAAISGRKAG